MKNWIKTATISLSALWLSSYLFGHSAMFPDGFEYDDTMEGETPELVTNSMNSILSQSAAAVTPCSGGTAGGYPCKAVDFLSFVAKADMGGGTANLNDIWGYTDPVTGAEIAIVGRTNGTSFVDVTNATSPVFLGFLPSHNNGSDSWRDVKTYNDHAYIVADGSGNNTHGLQVFDLTTLRSVTPGGTLTETAHLSGFGKAHNIFINEATGYAYVVGSNQCSGGLYIVDVSSPQSPTYAGCFSGDGYTHDVQCVIYNGPDTTYAGREICAAYNEDTITIVDVTVKTNPQQISRSPYQGSQYTHQGWFMDNTHTTLIMNDELDEQRDGINTTSYIWDVSDLDYPVEIGRYVGPTAAIDHNLYTKDGYIFESNYRAGLRILDGADVTNGNLTEVAYFDTIPGSNSAQFSGTWSNYVYFASGNIIMSDIGNGLFTVKPDWDAINNPEPEPITYCAAQGDNASDEWIAAVNIGGFSNTSGSAKYSDFTSQSITLPTGSSAVSLSPAFGGTAYNEYWKIWIDLNGDGDFTDANEEVFSSGGLSKTTVTGSLNIPAGTSPITTRLRVVMRYNTAPVPCGSFNYGEVEDYTVVITEDDTPPPPSDTFENTTSVSIPDNNSTGVTSAIVVNLAGAAGTVSVDVDISHTYIGDLIVDVIHPDGTVYNVHNRSGGSSNDIQQSYSVNAGAKPASGTWNLRVRDLAGQDIGTINLWRLTF